MNNNETEFAGLGKHAARGKSNIPLALKLSDSGCILPGAVCSHEVEDGDHPLLLSQTCPAKLGMVKKMHGGIIEFEG